MSKLVNTDISFPALDAEELGARADMVARQLALMSHPGRLMVLCRLLEGEAPVGALQRGVGLSQSALSQHLARLREAGMVETRRQGQTIHYRLSDPRVREMIAALYRIYCAPH